MFAGGQPTWVKGLSSLLATNISDMMVPWEEIAVVERTGVGEDGVRVPFANGGSLSMESITPGVVGGTDADIDMQGYNIVPVPKSVTVPIADHYLENAQESQIEEMVALMVEAYHKELILDLEAAIKAQLTASQHRVGHAATQQMTEALLRKGKWQAVQNGAPGDKVAIITAHSGEQLESDLVNKNLFAGVTQKVSEDGLMRFMKYSGVTVYPDAYLGFDTAQTPDMDLNVIANRRGIRIAFGGTGPRIKIHDGDAVNSRLSFVVWFKVAIPNPNLAVWMGVDQTT